MSTVGTVAEEVGQKRDGDVKPEQCACGVLRQHCDAPQCDACEVKENYPEGWLQDTE